MRVPTVTHGSVLLATCHVNVKFSPLPELRELCIEADVKLVACQMTVDLFGWKKEEFIPEVSEWAGAATYLTSAKGADITLFI